MAQTPNLLLTEVAANQNQKEVTVNDALINLDGAIAGQVSIAMTDADYTLSTGEGNQALGNMAFQFTGTLSAGRNIIVPASKKIYFIQNSTTGGHDLTVKTPSGSGVSVTVSSTSYTIVYSDGTNVLAASSAGGGSETLAGLLDVLITSPTDGQTIIYNSSTSKWENSTPTNGAFGGSIGDGSSTTISVAHFLDSTDVLIGVYDIATGAQEPATTTYIIVDSDHISITFASPPSLNAKRVVILAAGGTGNEFLAGLLDVLITSPTDGQALIYNSAASKWENGSGGGGGGGFAAGTICVPLPPATGQDTYANNSAVLCVHGRSILTPANTWKLRWVSVTTNTNVLGAKVYRTALEDPTIIDVTTITFAGGNPTPSSFPSGVVESDAISLVLDAAHDYYIVIAWGGGGSGAAYIRNYNAAWPLIGGGVASGDQSTLSPGASVPSVSGNYPLIQMVVVS